MIGKVLDEKFNPKCSRATPVDLVSTKKIINPMARENHAVTSILLLDDSVIGIVFNRKVKGFPIS